MLCDTELIGLRNTTSCFYLDHLFAIAVNRWCYTPRGWLRIVANQCSRVGRQFLKRALLMFAKQVQRMQLLKQAWKQLDQLCGFCCCEQTLLQSDTHEQ